VVGSGFTTTLILALLCGSIYATVKSSNDKLGLRRVKKLNICLALTVDCIIPPSGSETDRDRLTLTLTFALVPGSQGDHSLVRFTM